MGKYNDLYMMQGEIHELSALMEAMADLTTNVLSYLSIDHVQLGDSNGEIVGKLQYEDGTWRFHARRHDKPGTLGE